MSKKELWIDFLDDVWPRVELSNKLFLAVTLAVPIFTAFDGKWEVSIFAFLAFTFALSSVLLLAFLQSVTEAYGECVDDFDSLATEFQTYVARNPNGGE